MRIIQQAGHFMSGVAAVVLLASSSAAGSPHAALTGQVAAPSNAKLTARALFHGQSMAVPELMTFSHLPLPAPRASVRRQQFVDVSGVAAAGGNATITSDVSSNLVLVFNREGRLNALLTEGLQTPEGITTDAAETIYVSNTGNHNIAVYQKPYSALSRTLEDPDELPVDVAVSPRGVVAAANIFEPTGGFGGVTFFARGATTQCANIESPFWQYVFFDTFDASGNLYVAGLDPVGRVVLGQIVGGCKATTIKPLTTKNRIGYPGALQVVNGHILVGDQVTKQIYTYNLPVNGSLGAPIATTKLLASTAPIGFSMVARTNHLWVADATYFAPVDEYDYPGGALRKSAYGQYAIQGIGVNPIARP